MTGCRHHEVKLGEILGLPDCIAYGHPYSKQRTDKFLSGEADGTRPRKLPAGSYKVMCIMCPLIQDRLWVRLNVEHADMTWVSV